MKINVQVLDFDIGKVLSYDTEEDIDLITIGDFSCTRRNLLSIDEDMLKKLKNLRKRLLLQLPLVVKEDELAWMKKFSMRMYDHFDGFITGDLGLVRFLGNLGDKEIVYTTNITNRAFSRLLERDFKVTRVRPLMYKRTFIKENIGFPKDVVVYGNLMINCATFCFHSEDDLVENCRFGCKEPRKLMMNEEELHLVGRSLITENRFDITGKIGDIGDMDTATIMDLDLDIQEIHESIGKIKKYVRVG